jgi:hypothetical protein
MAIFLCGQDELRFTAFIYIEVEVVEYERIDDHTRCGELPTFLSSEKDPTRCHWCLDCIAPAFLNGISMHWSGM